ncbi:MAG: hypothetical protein EBX42_11515 [Betaproteobacteria bacterium]|nr:hypothetical protein [Betaproteobacteria bacterium]
MTARSSTPNLISMRSLAVQKAPVTWGAGADQMCQYRSWAEAVILQKDSLKSKAGGLLDYA